MSRPRVDVGVVTYNTRELTVAALRRLLDSEQGVDIRLLVRDNASADGTGDAIADLVPEAELDRGATNVGFAAGVNSLIARGDAPWFLALNSDAWPEPDAIGRLVATGEAAPSAGAIAPRLETPDGELEHSTHAFPSLAVAAATAAGGYRLVAPQWARRRALHGAWLHDQPREVDWAVGAALLMRRAALDAVGGFDERFFMYAEDVEWCWRARDAGWTTWFEPSALVRHVGNASGASAYGARRDAAWLANTYRLVERRRGPAYARAYRWINAAGAMRSAATGALTGRRDKAAYWRAQVPVRLRAPGAGPDGPPTTPGAPT